MKIIDNQRFKKKGKRNMYFKYKMPKAMAEDLLKGKNKNKVDIQEFLCSYINENYDIKGECIEVILF